jgi:hypothetical protein
MLEHGAEILYSDIFLYMVINYEDSNFGTSAFYILVGLMLEATAINKSAKRNFR